MRVLIVAAEATPVVSGVPRSFGEMAEGRSARGHHVQVISLASAPRPRWDRLRLSAVGLRLRFIAVDSTPFDTVNLHEPVSTISLVSLLRSLTGRDSLPVVDTHHFSLHSGVTGACALGRASGALTRRNVSRCAAVLTTTPASAPQFAQLGDLVSDVPWGVDHNVAPGMAREYDGTRPLRLLTVGQFRRYEGISIAIRAAMDQPDLDLTLAVRSEGRS